MPAAAAAVATHHPSQSISRKDQHQRIVRCLNVNGVNDQQGIVDVL